MAAIYGIQSYGLKSSEEVIVENQHAALEAIATIQRALLKWQAADYDANGRKDFPMKPLQVLIDTEFVNGEKLKLIPKALAEADLRNESPKPFKGYYFTLISPYTKWPKTEMAKSIVIFAKPAEQGKSGSCTFLVEVNGKAWFSNYELKSKIPKWPDRKEFAAKLWLPLKFDPS